MKGNRVGMPELTQVQRGGCAQPRPTEPPGRQARGLHPKKHSQLRRKIGGLWAAQWRPPRVAGAGAGRIILPLQGLPFRALPPLPLLLLPPLLHTLQAVAGFRTACECL